jgi:UDP-N-acetylmuramoyl-tripeptide--D-alanyl-D-alanine ligase
VGSAHIEHLESLEEIALEKGDIVASLPPSGTAVLNADDPLVAAQSKRTRAQVVRFGKGGDVRAERVEAIASKGFRFDLETPAGGTSLEVAGLGLTTVQNALAAAAAALAAGAALDDIARGLSSYRPIHGRLERRELSGGIVLIDDSYNANPQSTEAALRLLAELKGNHRAVAILGDMGELGVTSGAAHREVGSAAATLGIDFLIALGKRAECVGRGAVEAGMSPECAQVAADHDDACARACEILQDRDTVLVKGSRSMKMERIVEAIASEKGL